MSTDPGPQVLLTISNDDLARQMGLDLKEAGYTPAIATTAAQSLEIIQKTPPALILIDRMLGGDSGLALAQSLRSQGLRTPIVLMMARDSLEDRIACLEAGADDYFLKPYRSESFLRLIQLYLQPKQPGGELLRFGDLTLDLVNRTANRNGRVIDLTMKEFELLKYLMENPREVLAREQILENVWGYDFVGESNVIEVYVRYLRLKIDGENEKRLIQTVRGVGYVLRES
ncbi:MAG TPA: response regulator transcription factor [Trichocoleus sp.]